MNYQVIKDTILDIWKAVIPEKYQKIPKEIIGKVIDELNKFTKDNLIQNKVVIDKLGRYSLLFTILCFLFGWLNAAMTFFAIMIYMVILNDSIETYFNINKSLKKLLVKFILWIIGLTLLTYLSIASNLQYVLTNEVQLQIQMDPFKLIISPIIALFITIVSLTFYFLMSLLVFVIFNIIKKISHIILKNKYLRWLIVTLIYNYTKSQINKIITS